MYGYDRAWKSKGLNEEDLVLLYNPQRKKGLFPKLLYSWEGLYEVVKRLQDVFIKSW